MCATHPKPAPQLRLQNLEITYRLPDADLPSTEFRDDDWYCTRCGKTERYGCDCGCDNCGNSRSVCVCESTCYVTDYRLVRNPNGGRYACNEHDNPTAARHAYQTLCAGLLAMGSSMERLLERHAAGTLREPISWPGAKTTPARSGGGLEAAQPSSGAHTAAVAGAA